MKSLIVLLAFICKTLTGIAQDWEQNFQLVDSLQNNLSYYKAIQRLISMEKDAKKISNDSILAEVYVKIGGVYGRAQSKEDHFGLDYFLLAEAISQLNNLSKIKARAQFGIGSSYYDLGFYDSAVNSYNKALFYYENANDETTMSYLYSNLGLAYFKKKNNEKAFYYFNKALDMQQLLNDQYGIGATYSNLGLISLENDQFEKSLFLL